MTPEQFIFWLSGYFTGGKDNDSDCVVEDIRLALKEVKLCAKHVFALGSEE